MPIVSSDITSEAESFVIVISVQLEPLSVEYWYFAMPLNACAPETLRVTSPEFNHSPEEYPLVSRVSPVGAVPSSTIASEEMYVMFPAWSVIFA